MKFLVPNYSCLQIPVLSVINPPRKKFLGTPLFLSFHYYKTDWLTIPEECQEHEAPF